MAAVTAIIAAGVTVASTLISAEKEAEAIEKEGQAQKNLFYANAKTAEMNAQDALTQGYEEAGAFKGELGKFQGSQRASLSAQGVDINMGSALDIQSETATLGAYDEMQIKNNAWRQAWGFRQEGRDLTNRGEYAKRSSQERASNTLLAGGMTAVGQGIGGIYNASYGGGTKVKKI